MQTFLTSNVKFSDTAKVLDKKRLWKQVVEADQIIATLANLPTKSGKPRTGWKNHPAVLMWKNHFDHLLVYRDTILKESLIRGVQTSTKFYSDSFASFDFDIPEWVTDELVLSHQSNLLRKDFNYYSKYFYNTPLGLEYVWPTKLK
jgi:hypothetical protein